MLALCLFTKATPEVRIGLIAKQGSVIDLGSAGVERMQPLLEREDITGELMRLSTLHLAEYPLGDFMRQRALRFFSSRFQRKWFPREHPSEFEATLRGMCPNRNWRL